MHSSRYRISHGKILGQSLCQAADSSGASTNNVITRRSHFVSVWLVESDCSLVAIAVRERHGHLSIVLFHCNGCPPAAAILITMILPQDRSRGTPLLVQDLGLSAHPPFAWVVEPFFDRASF